MEGVPPLHLHCSLCSATSLSTGGDSGSCRWSWVLLCSLERRPPAVAACSLCTETGTSTGEEVSGSCIGGDQIWP
jgi:hypothetical protein